MKKLKPVIFVQGDRSFYRENLYGQNLLIKAMSEGITSPEELKKAAGLKTVAEVYRTLDKLAIRREYHDALQRNGVTLDTIVGGIKTLAETSVKDSTRLKGWELLLKSLGLDKYEKDEESGKNWEELVVEASEKNKNKPKEDVKQLEESDYEVIVPKTPDAEKKRQEEEKEVGQQLYE